MVLMSHILMVPSSLAEARLDPSGLNTILFTCRVCPRSTAKVVPFFQSQMRMP